MVTLFLKNFSLLNRSFNIRTLIFLITVFCFFGIKGQKIGNYVNNGSFESYWVYNVIYPIPYYWSAIDSIKPFGQLLIPPNQVPYSGYAYQWPKHGKNHFIGIEYCTSCSYSRAYPRNRMKRNLEAGKKYCVSMFVNLSNQSTHGIDALGFYFSDSSLDTITKCNIPLTYLMPQIQNPVNNIIIDTLNWVPITGTFVAGGNEKYLVLGNFKSDVNTNKTLANPTHLPMHASDYLFDAVSVIEVDLPAYAGPDVSTAPGHSVYIGRELDFAIDPGCMWFKLPEMTPLDTASGMWVQPIVTTTYVVRQILNCSSEKWDTVVVHMDLVGLEKMNLLKESLQIYPVPAKDYIELSCSDRVLLREIETVAIYNNLGQKLREETFMKESLRIKIEDLPPGSYLLYIKDHGGATLSKRFVISP